MSNVRKYTDRELLTYIKSLPSFNGIPNDYWILGVRSNEDSPDLFDDKFYLYKGEKFVLTTTGTTNPGLYALLHYNTYGVSGAAVVKANEWYYGLWKYGKHKGKMEALIQSTPILYYRDNNKDNKSDGKGTIASGYIGINFHTSTYLTTPIVSDKIGKWSYGCQVCNNTKDYYTIINKVKSQKSVTYCLIREF